MLLMVLVLLLPRRGRISEQQGMTSTRGLSGGAGPRGLRFRWLYSGTDFAQTSFNPTIIPVNLLVTLLTEELILNA